MLHALTTMQGWVLRQVNDLRFIYQMLFGLFLFNAWKIKLLAYYFGDMDCVFCFATDTLCYLWQIGCFPLPQFSICKVERACSIPRLVLGEYTVYLDNKELCYNISEYLNIYLCFSAHAVCIQNMKRHTFTYGEFEFLSKGDSSGTGAGAPVCSGSRVSSGAFGCVLLRLTAGITCSTL